MHNKPDDLFQKEVGAMPAMLNILISSISTAAAKQCLVISI